MKKHTIHFGRIIVEFTGIKVFRSSDGTKYLKFNSNGVDILTINQSIIRGNLEVLMAFGCGSISYMLIDNEKLIKYQ